MKTTSVLEDNSANDQDTSSDQEAVSNAKCEGPVKLVLPYNQPRYMKTTSVLEDNSANDQDTSSDQEVPELSDEEEDEPVVRITTRARITYGLDRFEKNALLIVTCLGGKPTAYLEQTFQRYKFEATVIETEGGIVTHEDLEKIRQFFQQDFSAVGAVALVLATSASNYLSPFSRSACKLEELDVKRLFDDNCQLQGKPKIFIVETLDWRDLGPYSGPWRTNGLPTDVLHIQSNVVEYQTAFMPLQVLCYAFNSLEEGCTVEEVLPTLWENEAEKRRFPRPDIRFYSTLTKELVLDRRIE